MATKDGRKTGGRKKGTPNKLTRDLIGYLEQRQYSPLSEVLDCLEKERPTPEEVKKYKQELVKRGISESEAKPLVRQFANDYLSTPQKIDVNMRLMEFVYPKRKSVEVENKQSSTITFVSKDEFNKGK